MRGVIAVPVLAVLTAVSLLSAAAPQDPQPQAPTVFRGAADVIRLDVSVLDKDRRPITGLTAADFTVIEDGVPQRVAAISEIIVAERDPKPTAWMRHVTPDIASNDLVDQLGDGRPYAIVMDDSMIAADDQFLVHSARAAGRYIIGGLGGSDVGAVIFPLNVNNTVDFTTDRAKLLDAIDRFDGRVDSTIDWVRRAPPPTNPRTPRGPTNPWAPGAFGGGTGDGGGDMPIRSTPLLARSQCQANRPLGATLEVVAARLAMVPNRRKTIVLVSVGMSLLFGPCAGELRAQMNNVLRMAQQANINIYGVDVADRQYDPNLFKQQREFLETVAAETGGAVVGGYGDPIEVSIDKIFAEAGSYYLVGYVSSNGVPDGKLRKLQVKVNRPDVTVRSRSGYLAPDPDSQFVREEMPVSNDMAVSSLWEGFLPGSKIKIPSSNDFALAGLYSPAGLPLRVSVVPVGLAAGAAGRVDVAVALSVRLPAPRGPIAETLTLIRNLYDTRGRAGMPVQEKLTLTLQPSAGDELRYDLFQRLTLAPGRQEMRLNAMSAALDSGGTVYVPFEVPDVARAPVVLSGIVLGTPPPADLPRTDILAPILPIIPTSSRNFAASDDIAAFFHIFQGSAAPVMPVTLKVLILDRRDLPVVDTTETMDADAFGTSRSAVRQIALPLAKLATGPYLLSISATRRDGPTSRHDVVFHVR